MPTKVKLQGTVVAEPDGIGGWLVMLPDGQVHGASTRTKVMQLAKCWFKANVETDAIGIGKIEWR